MPNRVNIVLTKDEDWTARDVIVCHSIEELFSQLQRYDTDTVYVIGGSTVYEQLLPYCDTAYVTKVDSKKTADKFFPDLDKMKDWAVKCESESMEHNGTSFKFVTYNKI